MNMDATRLEVAQRGMSSSFASLNSSCASTVTGDCSSVCDSAALAGQQTVKTEDGNDAAEVSLSTANTKVSSLANAMEGRRLLESTLSMGSSLSSSGPGSSLTPSASHASTLFRADESSIVVCESSKSTKVKIARVCPSCHKRVWDLIAHYETTHGEWDHAKKLAYYALERLRIEKSEYSEDTIGLKLRAANCFSPKAVHAITEILNECGVRVSAEGAREKVVQFCAPFLTWLRNKGTFNTDRREAYESVCRIYSNVFGSDAPSLRLLVERKSVVAEQLRQQLHMAEELGVVETAERVKRSLQALRASLVVLHGFVSGSTDRITDDEYRELVRFFDEQCHKFRKLVQRNRLSEASLVDIDEKVSERQKQQTESSFAKASSRVGRGRSSRLSAKSLPSGLLEKPTSLTWRKGFQFSDEWKQFVLQNAHFKMSVRWKPEGQHQIDSFIPDDILHSGDEEKIKRLRFSVEQGVRGLWQRFQCAQVLLDYDGDLSDVKAATDFYFSVINKKRWPESLVHRFMSGILHQFRNGIKPERCDPESTLNESSIEGSAEGGRSFGTFLSTQMSPNSWDVDDLSSRNVTLNPLTSTPRHERMEDYTFEKRKRKYPGEDLAKRIFEPTATADPAFADDVDTFRAPEQVPVRRKVLDLSSIVADKTDHFPMNC